MALQWVIFKVFHDLFLSNLSQTPLLFISSEFLLKSMQIISSPLFILAYQSMLNSHCPHWSVYYIQLPLPFKSHLKTTLSMKYPVVMEVTFLWHLLCVQVLPTLGKPYQVSLNLKDLQVLYILHLSQSLSQSLSQNLGNTILICKIMKNKSVLDSNDMTF